MLLTSTIACRKTEITPVSEQIRKVWSAHVVQENSTTVFTKGASNNAKPGYSNFRLDLSTASIVKLTEFENTTFTGQWNVSADEKTLTLTSLNPQPNGTNGTIQYSIGALSDNALTLIRTSANAKTGGSLNEYQLVNP